MEHKEEIGRRFRGFVRAVCLIALGTLAYVLFSRSPAVGGTRLGNCPNPFACSDCLSVDTCPMTEIDEESY